MLEERQRLARELHDSVTQSLYSVTLYANAAALALASGKGEVAAGYLSNSREIAREECATCGCSSSSYTRPYWRQRGWSPCCRRGRPRSKARGLRTQFRVEGERRLPIAIEEDLYWIAQEALNNVGKHAAAQHVTVHLHFTAVSVLLEVIDDGVGFDLQAVRSEGRGSGGLRSIAERTERLGGRLTHESGPGQGTRLAVEVTL